MFENIVSDDSSSSSSDATSTLVEEHARLVAAQARCANILIFGRKGLPSDVFVRAADQRTIREPIVIDRNVIQTAALPTVPSTGMEIVP